MRASSTDTGGVATTRGFTLLEIMMTLALVGAAVMPMLLIRERSTMQAYQAHHLNTVRMLARELLSELEFHELDQMAGQFDGFPGFSYTIEVEEIDLVTGESEKDEDDPFGQDYEDTGGYTPADAIGPNEDENQEMDYPARLVTLTIKYPNLRPDAGEEEAELTIETIFPPLPKEDAAVNNPFAK